MANLIHDIIYNLLSAHHLPLFVVLEPLVPNGRGATTLEQFEYFVVAQFLRLPTAPRTLLNSPLALNK